LYLLIWFIFLFFWYLLNLSFSPSVNLKDYFVDKKNEKNKIQKLDNIVKFDNLSSYINYLKENWYKTWKIIIWVYQKKFLIRYFSFNQNELKKENINIEKILNSYKNINKKLSDLKNVLIIKFNKKEKEELKKDFDNLKNFYLKIKNWKINIYLLNNDSLWNKINNFSWFKIEYYKELWNVLKFIWIDLINLLVNYNSLVYKPYSFSNILKIIFNLLMIWIFFYFLKFALTLWITDIKDTWLIKYIPWRKEYDDEIVDYWGNKHLLEILNEIKTLYKKWVLNKFFDWILLYWPPWTWKTLFWKKIAKELNLPFYYISSNNFKSMYYWGTWKKIREVFRNIQKDINRLWFQTWIIFIDELDSIWIKRVKSHEATAEGLNTLLTEIDWFKNKKFIVIWATNRYETLDDALLSRFDYKIYVWLPNREEREEILLNQFIFNLLNF